MTVPTSACLGREPELERLTMLHGEAEGRGARLAILVGPSGIGKSRILDELRSRTRRAGGVVLEGRAAAGVAFGPFVQIVRGALTFLGEVGVRPSIEMTHLGCSAGCHALWHEHHGADAPGDLCVGLATADDAAGRGRRRFFAAIAGLLRDVASVRVPVVLLHDLERADRETLDLLTFVLDDEAPWSMGATVDGCRALFVGAESGAATLESALAGHARCTRIEVGRLSADGVREMLSSPGLVERVLARTGGVPELIESLLDTEPLTPERRFEQELRALGPEARRLVDCLAVVDRPTEVERLFAIAGVAPSKLVLGELARLRSVERVSRDGRLELRFARERDRTLVYDALSSVERSAVHLRVAASASGDAQCLADAAHHALLGGDVVLATPLALRAAAALAARHAYQQGIDLLQAIVDRLNGTTPAEVHARLARLTSAIGDHRRTIRHAKIAVAACPDDAQLLGLLGEALSLSGELDEAAEVLDRACALAHAAKDAWTLAQTEARIGELSFQRGLHGLASEHAARAREGARSLGDLALELQASNTIGKVALAGNDLAAAERLFGDAVARARHAGLAHHQAQASTNLGIALLRRRDLDRAAAAFRDGAEAASLAEDARERSVALCNLAVVAHMRRDYRAAESAYHRASRALWRLGNRSLLATMTANLGSLYATLGDASRARATCDFAAQMAGAAPTPRVAGEISVLVGRIAALEGDHEQAAHSLRQGLSLWHGIDDVDAALVTIDLGKAALAQGDGATASAIAQRLTEHASADVVLEAWTLLADVADRQGRATTAPARRAVAVANEAGDAEGLLGASVRLATAHLRCGELAQAAKVVEQAEHLDATLAHRVPEHLTALFARRPVRLALDAVITSLAKSSAVTDAPAPTHAIPAPARSLVAPAHPGIVGDSSAIRRTLSRVERVAASDCIVMLHGESGTGKELFAEAIHRASPRRDRPLVKVNCSALVETLLLSELFGHERGAFTGAQTRKKGRFELAHGGTLLLDEIGDISARTQVALLRVLQEREFERVGGTEPIKVDVRIIAATHRNLERMVEQGTFREDLYYRLRGVLIEVPALRERFEDLQGLAAHLLGRAAAEHGGAPKTLRSDALELLRRHAWPGNVRELDNVLRSAALLTDARELGAPDLAPFCRRVEVATAAPTPAPVVTPAAMTASPAPDEMDLAYGRIRRDKRPLGELKKELERACIVRALAETGGHITRAAELLGMTRSRLSQLVKELGLSQGDAA